MRKIEDERDARVCLGQVNASGRPLTEWAREHGIDARSLNIWKVNMDRDARPQQPATTAGPRFVEIVAGPVDSVVHATTAGPSKSGRYIVVIGDMRVEIDDGFCAQTLTRLISTLRSC